MHPFVKSVLVPIILMTTLSLSLQAQNLVVNGDCEEYSDCPQGFSEAGRCTGWKAATCGTSDYYNNCSTNTSVSIPDNDCGTQAAFNGNGYLGIIGSSYSAGCENNSYTGHFWWEYLQGKLSVPLEQGKLYHFSMEVSLAECSDLVIKELGVYFSQTAISSTDSKPLPVNPQCVFFEPNYYTDTLNWIHLEADFVAEGNEQFLTIGNFRDSITNDTLRFANFYPETNLLLTYFFIDNIVLTSDDLISNAFTPDGDGVNDVWWLPMSEKPGVKTVSILNRWGNLIKEGDLNGFTWDGKTVDGSECSDGTYFYRVSNSSIAGFIELIR